MIEQTLNDRYRLENKIGEGGMATVFSGMDTMLRRRVAIKMLRPQYAADEDFIQRFYSEARHAAKLSHPNIVNIYDVGRQGDTYFIVMELVEGATLAEMIERDHPLPERVAIDYVTQICNGLAYAHRQGLLHRDIKPANILVTKDDVVKLSDFGIAHAVSQQTMVVTQPGMVIGSVYYLSPEQAQGLEMRETSDLYSLGVVLFQMLTGKLPYTGDSPITVAIKHVSGPVPTIDPASASISPAVAAIVRKLLQKDPLARFASATEVASALREAREHPTDSRPFETRDTEAVVDGATRVMERISVPAPPPRRSPFPDTPPTQVEAKSTPRRFPVLRTALVASLFVLSVLAGFEAVLHTGLAHQAPVRLANYTGMLRGDAEAALTKLGVQFRETEVPSERVARGIIVSQEPKPDSTAAAHQMVELFVSSGLPRVEMTDLRSFSRDDAERFLRNAKLTPRFEERFNPAPPGTVIDQLPLPGTQVAEHGVVTLVVSKGAKPVDIPDIVSLSLDDATKVLKSRGLALDVSDRTPSENIPENVVASQDPKPGTQAEPGTHISVVVSSGPGITVVPNVGGQTVDAATAAIRNAGLDLHLVYLAQSGTPTGTVIEQSPPASASVRSGDSVTLTIAVPGVVPNVAQMTLDQAKTSLVNAGYVVGNVAYTTEGTVGKVARTEPEANAPLRPGESVTIYLSQVAGGGVAPAP